jgi:hypothetical protein
LWLCWRSRGRKQCHCCLLYCRCSYRCVCGWEVEAKGVWGGERSPGGGERRACGGGATHRCCVGRAGGESGGVLPAVLPLLLQVGGWVGGWVGGLGGLGIKVRRRCRPPDAGVCPLPSLTPRPPHRSLAHSLLSCLSPNPFRALTHPRQSPPSLCLTGGLRPRRPARRGCPARALWAPSSARLAHPTLRGHAAGCCGCSSWGGKSRNTGDGASNGAGMGGGARLE